MTSCVKSQRTSFDLLQNNLPGVYANHPAIWARHEIMGLGPVRDGSVDAWQEKVLESKQKYQILNCSRQSGKSTVAAALSLHTGIYHPGSLVLLVSPSQRQSGEIFRKVKDHIKALPYRLHLLEDNKLSCTLDNGSRIVSLPGEEGTIRGFSNAALIIEDEASRVEDSLYASIRPMLAVSKGRLILMSTPHGKRGHFFEEWEKGSNWNKVEIPWSTCPRITPEFIAEERTSLGEWWVRQEYECEFVQTVDQVFSYDLVMSAMDDNLSPLFSGGL